MDHAFQNIPAAAAQVRSSRGGEETLAGSARHFSTHYYWEKPGVTDEALRVVYERSKREFPFARFWALVDRSAGPQACWHWKGGISGKSYGYFLPARLCGTHRAHRIVLIIKMKRALRPYMLAMHACDNRLCCNPDHLSEGTAKQNAVRGPAHYCWNPAKHIGE